jgi:hypothetical protein
MKNLAPSSGTLHVSLLAVASLTLAPACYPKAGPPPAAPTESIVASASARWPGVTAAALSAGHDIFLAHCDECHGYPDISAIADERWPKILDSMARKSHLNADERDEVLHFILSSRSEPATR